MSVLRRRVREGRPHRELTGGPLYPDLVAGLRKAFPRSGAGALLRRVTDELGVAGSLSDACLSGVGEHL